MPKVTPFLMFDDQLEAAMEFYTATFPDSESGTCPPGRTSERSAEFVVVVMSSWLQLALTSRSQKASRATWTEASRILPYWQLVRPCEPTSAAGSMIRWPLVADCPAAIPGAIRDNMPESEFVMAAYYDYGEARRALLSEPTLGEKCRAPPPGPSACFPTGSRSD